MKTLEDMTRWKGESDEQRDCIGEFKNLWKAAAPPERQLIRAIVYADEQDPAGRVQYVRVKELYHEILPMMRRVKVDTTTRRSHVAARWKDMPTLTEWETYFRLVARCPLLIGEGEAYNGRTWRADFDWLINPQNFAKVVEGKYGL